MAKGKIKKFNDFEISKDDFIECFQEFFDTVSNEEIDVFVFDGKSLFVTIVHDDIVDGGGNSAFGFRKINKSQSLLISCLDRFTSMHDCKITEIDWSSNEISLNFSIKNESEPDKKGIVEREVIRVVTPGTVTDEKMLDRKENNYIISVVFDKQRTGIAIADLSTGLFQTTELETQRHTHTIIDELAKIRPAECIISPADFNNPAILKLLRAQKDMNINCFHPWDTYVKRAKKFLTSHFHISSLLLRQILYRSIAFPIFWRPAFHLL